MKWRPFFTKYFGLCFRKPFSYECSGCGAIGQGTPDRRPRGWKKMELDEICHFFCLTCRTLGASELRARSRFPKKKEDFWYCGEFHDYRCKLYQAGKPRKVNELDLPCETFLINPFPDAGGQWPISEGDILPCIKINGWIGYYLVTKKWRSFGSDDYAMWDDGYSVNLEFHHCERVKLEAKVD